MKNGVVLGIKNIIFGGFLSHMNIICILLQKKSLQVNAYFIFHFQVYSCNMYVCVLTGSFH